MGNAENTRNCSTCAHKQTPAFDMPCCDCFHGNGASECWTPAEKDRFIEKSNESKDNINPDHYKKECSLECIEAMELIFGGRAVLDFCVCNAWKYIWRWKNKNGVEDLHKADWYIDRASMINRDNITFCYDGEITRIKGYISTEINKWEDEHEEPTV